MPVGEWNIQVDAASVLLESLGIALTPEFSAALFDPAREKITIGGWRAGKSSQLACEFMVDLMSPRTVENIQAGRRTLYWLVGPDYVQTNEEFRYLAEWSTKLGIQRGVSAPQEGPRSLTWEGGITIETKSASHYERLGSVAPNGIGVCEAGQTSEEVRTMLLGRAAEKRAWIRYAGTLEDDEGHPRWAWYQELADKWLTDRNSEHSAHSLPSWANTSIFPEGRQDPEILRLEELFDDYTFKRRIAAIPTGVQFAVYPQLTDDTKLRVLSGCPTGGAIHAAGGIDFGTVHPSALVVVQVFPDARDGDPSFVGPRGIATVRECWINQDDPGDTARLQAARKLLAQKWKCWYWATDPNERYMARSSFAEAVSGSEGAREHRIGMVTARLNLNKLMFDMSGPGVPELVAEMKRVHRRKQQDGQLKLLRIDDDRTAALEDAIELLDGKELLRVPKPSMIRTRARNRYARTSEFRRV